MHNFIVMRDKTGDKRFLLQKKIEALFTKKHPSKWIPLYSMVTFSHIDYNEALQIGKKQEKIMQEIMKIENIDSIWDSEFVEKKFYHFYNYKNGLCFFKTNSCVLTVSTKYFGVII